MATNLIPTWTLPDRIRKAREFAGLEQDELASRLYMGRSTLSNWENGVNTPHRLKLERLADVCGVDPSWLIGDSVTPIGTGEVPHEEIRPIAA